MQNTVCLLLRCSNHQLKGHFCFHLYILPIPINFNNYTFLPFFTTRYVFLNGEIILTQ